jgi:hypothetical protein
MVVMEALKPLGDLERPGVIFLHDQHTDALEKQNKDCSACHVPEPADKDRLSLKFKRIEDGSREDLMDLYHTECIGCHKETSAVGKKAGPIETCGDCHRKTSRWISSRAALAFDASLHYRHTEAVRDKSPNPGAPRGDCGQCHHEYDEKTKKLFYAKDKEGSCRYCHLKETEENRISMRLVSHSACIDCHKQTAAAKKEAGPVKCSGCHDPGIQKKIEKIDPAPRLKRNQPDLVLIRSIKSDADPDGRATRMFAVPFDHKAHESYNSTCLECHHAGLESCSKKCHTPQGAKTGGYVTLESAMHLKSSGKSCLGCHNINQNTPSCAACHGFMAADTRSESSCAICHIKPPEGPLMPAVRKGAQNDDQAVMALMSTRKSRVSVSAYKEEDIPDMVTIKDLSDKYEHVKMPHRRIVQALLTRIKDNKLADYFHADKGTVCRSCHHNSPINPKPPRCGSCHGKPFDRRHPFRPGIKGAYHQQCMGCHQVLKLEKPASTRCIDCHKDKKI